MNESELFTKEPWDNILQSLKVRIFFWIGVLWLPPVTAVLLAKTFTNNIPDIDLFEDFAFHVRCLVSIPILLLTEEIIYKAVNDVIPTAIKRGIINPDQTNKLNKQRILINKLQKSLKLQFTLLIFSILIVYNKIFIELPPEISTWRTIHNTWYIFASWWNRWIGLTVYYFFIFRWLYKFLLWSLFIYKFTLLKPNLQSHHPDEMGGIAFLARRHIMFGLIATAISSVSSANIALTIIYGKFTLKDFYLPLGLYVVTMIVFLTLPLFILSPLLLRTKITGRYKFDSIAYLYAESFERKWYIGENIQKGELLGSPDFQSLNDLLESYSKIQAMRIIPLTHRMIVLLICLIAIPLLPLGLLQIPFSEMLSLIINHFL